jgi:5-methylcytosine-specific restriction protein A
MRRAHETNTLVIVSNHVKAIYEDRWDINDVLHYTGMGQVGDQEFRGNQNITLHMNLVQMA